MKKKHTKKKENKQILNRCYTFITIYLSVTTKDI